MSQNTTASFVGNATILRQLAGKQLHHAYIISGPKGSGRHTLARMIAQQLVCTALPENRPCGKCTHCRKAAAGIHPDIIAVSSTMEDGKRLSPARARALQADACISPNEANRKVYLFEQAGELSDAVQNVLLKLIEDGPEYTAFLFVTEHGGQLLPTVRSRCEELKLGPVTQAEALDFLKNRYPNRDPALLRNAAARCGGILGSAVALLESEPEKPEDADAAEFCSALAAKDEAALAAFMAQHEKNSREQLIALFAQSHTLLYNALLLSVNGNPGPCDAVCCALSKLPGAVLIGLDDLLLQGISRLEGNGGTGHVLGWLTVSCAELLNR